MKFIIILLTLLFVNLAAKAALPVINDPVKSTTMRQTALAVVESSIQAHDGCAVLKRGTCQVSHMVFSSDALLETRWERSQRISQEIQQRLRTQNHMSRVNNYRLNEGEYIILKRLKLIM